MGTIFLSFPSTPTELARLTSEAPPTRSSLRLQAKKQRSLPSFNLFESLPSEVKNLVLESIDGDLADFKRISLTNKYFRSWASSEALKKWPKLRQQLRHKNVHICEICCTILPAIKWVEIAPRYWKCETTCIGCTIKWLGTHFKDALAALTLFEASHTANRACMCCRADFGPKRRPAVHEKLAKDMIFCEYCLERVHGASRTTQDVAVRCQDQYLEMLQSGELEMLRTGQLETLGSDGAPFPMPAAPEVVETEEEIETTLASKLNGASIWSLLRSRY